MISMSSKSFTLMTIGIAAALSEKDQQIAAQDLELESLRAQNAALVGDFADAEYEKGELEGALTETRDYLQHSENGNKDAFNENQQLLADNGMFLQRNRELTFENQELKQGKPVVAATQENVRGIIQAMITGDKDVIGDYAHRLMDCPLDQAIQFVTDAVQTASMGAATELAEVLAQRAGEETSGLVTSMDPEAEDTARVVEDQVG